MSNNGSQWEQLQWVNDFTFESHLSDHKKFQTALGCWSDALLKLIEHLGSLSMLSFADTLLVTLCLNMYRDSALLVNLYQAIINDIFLFVLWYESVKLF